MRCGRSGNGTKTSGTGVPAARQAAQLSTMAPDKVLDEKASQLEQEVVDHAGTYPEWRLRKLEDEAAAWRTEAQMIRRRIKDF